MSAAVDFLNKAADLMTERGKQYDQPQGERSMGKAVAAFNVITGQSLTEAEGWLLLQILKDVRQWQRPAYHADSAEDCVAYAALKAEALEGAAMAAIDPALLGGAGAELHALAEDVVIWPPKGHVDTEAFRRKHAVGADVAFPTERGLYFAPVATEDDGA